ncbi:pyrroloquinoline quinone biosynthesis protein PqqE [Variovorax ginsengisoli]|uniref:PqqA peptide cyclase n=1 Tax=Variovorax ginsengisoli TaxID=363844 RepID=A0ABT8SGI8_9BURK|nr:pyrroloquinoline quinone biosynthesis protein PqqE [Variovorax ginsengisoli]MDN8618299.1 pyrroloquinoline quinone biosynthesis protein PqqE [Variovorax ginsengisoli]MDO1537469.1 pyrroloquinoline quinone biosynthesis protein PqqE [Variovorax ginsengisoli]
MTSPGHGTVRPPLWLLAELTYRCPLHCAFCSNPVDYARHDEELDTASWRRVLAEARALGAVQLGFSGGEPLLRDDLEELVAHARGLGFYTNLITSGVGLTSARARALKAAGLDHIQLSFQDSTRELNDFLSSTRTFELKSKVAGIIKAEGYPMVLNCVMHRFNLQHVGRIIEMAERMGADFLELANTQYYGWAWLNRAALMPTAEELRDAEAIVQTHRARLASRMKVIWVSPDYADAKPKPCMAGWGTVFMVVAPDGVAMPCHSARMLPGPALPNLQAMSVREAWHDSEAFNRYRGQAWMDPTCSGCDERDHDFGGCRCQAFLVTGDAAATDPVCPKSAHRGRIDDMLDAAAAARADGASTHTLRFVPGARRGAGLVFRSDENSLACSAAGALAC